MSSGSKTVPMVAAAVAATAVVVGAVVVMKSREAPKKKADEDDEAFSCVKPSAPKKLERKVTASAPTTAEAKPTAVSEPAERVESVSVSQPAPTPVADEDDLLDAVLDEVVPRSTPSSAVASTANKAATAASFEGERTELERLGLSLKVPKGWEVREELSPVPNVAMITVWNPEFATMPNAEIPGAVPVIILSVEDIHGENLSLAEFKERSKTLSMQQMLMMTGGAIQPVVRKDNSIQEGPFRHYLEYAQSMPPYFDISVINLLEVRNGVAYVFQMMASPRVMNDYKSLFMQIARDTNVTTMDSSALGYLEVKTGKVSIQVDTTWSWTYPSADSVKADEPLATFELTSSVKKEKISLYETDNVPETDHKPRGEKDLDGVKIVSAFNGTQERKTFSYNGYSLVVEPEQKAISFLPEPAVALALKSVKVCSDAPRPKEGATFVTSEYGYEFDVVGGGRVVSTKLGKDTVVYAPLGVPQDPTKEMTPEEQGPTVTIRIGNPKDDPDCMGTLDEWKSRIETEAASSDISNIKIIDLKNQKCLSFRSKEMQETGPNEKTEVVGEVYIFVRDGVTTLIRWEAPRNQFRKFERDLSTFLESFHFLA